MRMEWILSHPTSPCRAWVPCNRTRLTLAAVESVATVRLPQNFVNGSFDVDWTVGETLIFGTQNARRVVPVEIVRRINADDAGIIFVCADAASPVTPPSPPGGAAAAGVGSTTTEDIGVVLGVSLAMAIVGVVLGLVGYYGWRWWKRRQDLSVQSGLELWVDDDAVVDDLRHDELLVVRPTPLVSEMHEMDDL